MASNVLTGTGNGSKARVKAGPTISIIAMRPIKFRTASPCELWSWCELIRFQTSHSRSRLKLTADPRECRAGNDLRPKDVRVPLSYQDRSPVRPIALQIAQEFVDRH